MYAGKLLRHTPWLTLVLCALCLGAFCWQVRHGHTCDVRGIDRDKLSEEQKEQAETFIAFVRNYGSGTHVTGNAVRSGEPGQIARAAGQTVTSLFLHSSLDHLCTNLALLLLTGVLIEPGIGWWRVLLLFLVSGIAGAFAVPLGLGASAGIAGLCVAGVVLAHKTTIFSLPLSTAQTDRLEEEFWCTFMRTGLLMPSVLAMALADLLGWVGQLTHEPSAINQIGYRAHIYGYAAGVAACLLMVAFSRQAWTLQWRDWRSICIFFQVCLTDSED